MLRDEISHLIVRNGGSLFLLCLTITTCCFGELGKKRRISYDDCKALIFGDRTKGVEVLSEETVASVDGTTVHTGSGRTLEADAIVAGLGIVPNVELAEEAGLPVDNGIVVDKYGRVDARDDVFAAGDVANYPNLVLGSQFRVEHEDHANTHGRFVGASG